MNREFFPDNYTLVRCDRDSQLCHKSWGGGVFIAVSDKYSIKKSDVLRSAFVEACWVEIKFYNQSFFIAVAYIVPGAPEKEYRLLYEFLSANIITLDPKTQLLICGDFNLPELYTLTQNSCSASNSVELFKNFSSFHNLLQVNNIFNHNNRILDLILSNVNLEVSHFKKSIVREDKHHPTLFFKLKTEAKIKFKHLNQAYPSVTEKFCFNKGDYDLLYSLIQDIDFSNVLNCNEIDQSLNLFYDHMLDALNTAIPKKKNTFNSNFPQWYSKTLIKLIKSKNKIRHKIRRRRIYGCTSSRNIDNMNSNNNNNNLDGQFCHYRRLIKKELRRARRLHARETEFVIKSNPKKFFEFFQARPTRLENSFFFNGVHFDDPTDIANEFGKFFQSVFVASSDNGYPQPDGSNFPNSSSAFKISDEELLAALSHLKGSLVCGPDVIPSFIYKGCSDAILVPLKHILDLCISHMVVPDRWKESRITPLFKKGDKSVGENYRGISILPAASKILEIILYNRILSIFSKNVAREQHGFVKGRSPITNLLAFTDYVSLELIDNNEVHVIYFDFLKAFDRVDHELLLRKLSDNFDIPPYLIRLLRSYLHNRVSYVSFNDIKSFYFSVLSGVPQGSHLGPLLFLLFINDLPNCLNFVLCLLFADDLKIFKSIKSEADMILLQKDINNVVEWSNQNLLPINESKCRLMVFAKNKSRFDTIQYTVGGTVLTPQSEVKDLGVVFDSKLSFDNHISSITSDAYRILGFVIRSSHSFRNLNTMILIYNAFVRSKLEYASTVWHRHVGSHGDKLEKVQKKFLRYLHYRKYGIYPHYDKHPVRTRDMQLDFNILSLQNRRHLNDAVFTYRILNYLIDCPDLLSRFNLHVPSRRTRQTHKIFSFPVLTSRLNSPLSRCMNLLNNLCANQELDFFNMSLNDFKKRVTEYLLSDHI